jgi:chromosome segregation ATPase
MISRRLVALTAVLLVAGSISLARAQDSAEPGSSSQPDSLGDAARKARAQKKDSSKPAKVFTNEDVGSLKGTISVIGNEPAPATGTDKTAEKNDDKKPASGADAKPTNGADVKDAKKEQPKDELSWRAKFAAARKTLADDTKELDILQREFNLKQEQYSQDPNWAMHEQNNRADINKTQSEIDTKKQVIEKDKQALSDLEDELHKSGGDPGWATEPPSDSSGSKSEAPAS